jgi:hypothetical protein
MQQKNTKHRVLNKFKGIISSGFDLYMSVYTAKEDQYDSARIRLTQRRLTKELLQRLVNEETWSSDEGNAKVCSIERCLNDHRFW